MGRGIKAVAMLMLPALPALAAACSTRLPHPTYTAHATADLVAVKYPPPPAHVELVPARPQPDAVWIDGEWSWRRQKWSWRAGRWVNAPAGSMFSPWIQVRGGDGTLYVAPGAWHDAKGAPLDEPAPLAVAGDTSGAVYDTEGAVEHTGRAVGSEPGRGHRDGGT
jgi:hypothetical protein